MDQYRAWFRKKKTKTTFRNIRLAQEFQDRLKWFEHFPWRPEQQHVRERFFGSFWTTLALQGIFGNGKTTLLRGLLTELWITHDLALRHTAIVAFNICIRNELRQGFKNFHVQRKYQPHIRTFDSIVFSICEAYGMPSLQKPDYEGRRAFALQRALREKQAPNALDDVRFVFVDEAQDLHYTALRVLKFMFPRARFIVLGDIFQSIQKEPRTSLLWHLLQVLDPEEKFMMRQTPRVPPMILTEIKDALMTHYPEFHSTLEGWVSRNDHSPDSVIRWDTFSTYTNLFEKLEDVMTKDWKGDFSKIMLLAFSSNITVRGSLGDIARMRRFLIQKQWPFNPDYKKMDSEKLFLSTVNSSKGLERDFVVLCLTFPLELAFANFSQDVLVNLMSVGLSRAKKEVVVLVPNHADRFSYPLFSLYPKCPKPPQETRVHATRLLQEKGMKEMTTEADFNDVAGFLERPLSVTEILRQNIFSFGLMEEIQSCARFQQRIDFSASTVPLPSFPTEEEKALFGLLTEHWCATLWTGDLPLPLGTNFYQGHAYYSHCMTKLRSWETQLRRLFGPAHSKLDQKLEYLTLYSMMHLALHNRIVVQLCPAKEKQMHLYLCSRMQDIIQQNPKTVMDDPNVEVLYQHNARMPLMTGIGDVVLMQKKEKRTHIIEIKTSKQKGYLEEALFQALCYVVMGGNPKSTLEIYNPVRGERILYRFQCSDLFLLRRKMYHELLEWNTSCFLAKRASIVPTSPNLKCSCTHRLFLLLRYAGEDDSEGMVSILQIVSRTKCQKVYHGCWKDLESAQQKQCTRSKNHKTTVDQQVADKIQWIGEEDVLLDTQSTFLCFDADKAYFEAILPTVDTMFPFLDKKENLYARLNYQPREEVIHHLDVTDTFAWCCLTACFLRSFLD